MEITKLIVITRSAIFSQVSSVPCIAEQTGTTGPTISRVTKYDYLYLITDQDRNLIHG
jgi:hypothetical protein